MELKVYLLLISSANTLHLSSESENRLQTDKFDFFGTVGDFGSKLQLMSLDKQESKNE